MRQGCGFIWGPRRRNIKVWGNWLILGNCERRVTIKEQVHWIRNFNMIYFPHKSMTGAVALLYLVCVLRISPMWSSPGPGPGLATTLKNLMSSLPLGTLEPRQYWSSSSALQL